MAVLCSPGISQQVAGRHVPLELVLLPLDAVHHHLPPLLDALRAPQVGPGHALDQSDVIIEVT